MKRCREQFPYEKRTNKEVQRLLKNNQDYPFGETEDLCVLPKNTDKPITLEQMMRNRNIQF